MWNKFKELNEKYSTEISWWFIGYFFAEMLGSIKAADWTWVFIEAALIVMNYLTWKSHR